MSENDGCDNGYEDIDAIEEYQEAEGDVCVQEDYFEENEFTGEKAEINTSNIEEEDEEEEQVQIHGEDDIVFSQESEPHDPVEEENEEVSQDEEEKEEEREGEEEEEVKKDNDAEEQNAAEEEKEEKEGDEKEKEEEEKEEEKEEEIVCTFTEEEKLAEYQILDAFQRQMDEEHYTLRKLRSIIGHQSENIERMRKRIAEYTKNAQDRKAMDAMETLTVMKADRERAVEERRISTDQLAEVRAKRSEKVQDLKTKGLKISSSVTYLIEDKELKTLYSAIRSILKYNSFAVLKNSIEELDDVIFNVANVCDNIDDYLTTRDLKPRDINKLNTKDRRVSVLYDKLLKWRLYKVQDPDIRPTDYESFMYDPDDMFSDSEDEKEEKRREEERLDSRSRPKREMRAVRGGETSPRESRTESRSREGSHRRTGSKSAHSPVRPPTPPAADKSPVRPAIVRRAVRGGSPDEAASEERPKERPLRAERGGNSSGPRRDQPIRKRRAEPMENESYKRRQMSPPAPRRPAMRRSPIRKERHHSPRDDRSQGRDRGAPHRRERGRGRTTLLSTPPIKPAHSFDNRRSPSPPFRGRNRENFQISVRNESFRPRSPGRHDRFRDDRGPMRDDRPMTRAPGSGYRGRGRSAPPGRRSDDRRSGGSYRR